MGSTHWWLDEAKAEIETMTASPAVREFLATLMTSHSRLHDDWNCMGRSIAQTFPFYPFRLVIIWVTIVGASKA